MHFLSLTFIARLRGVCHACLLEFGCESLSFGRLFFFGLRLFFVHVEHGLNHARTLYGSEVFVVVVNNLGGAGFLNDNELELSLLVETNVGVVENLDNELVGSATLETLLHLVLDVVFLGNLDVHHHKSLSRRVVNDHEDNLASLEEGITLSVHVSGLLVWPNILKSGLDPERNHVRAHNGFTGVFAFNKRSERRFANRHLFNCLFHILGLRGIGAKKIEFLSLRRRESAEVANRAAL